MTRPGTTGDLEHKLFSFFRSTRRTGTEPKRTRPASIVVMEQRGFRSLSSRLADANTAGGDIPMRAHAPNALPASQPRVRDVFTPTQPRSLGPLFIGREWYLRRLLAAV